AAADEEDRLQPYVHWDVAGLEDGPDLHGEFAAAGVALVGADAGALALHLAGLADGPAVRADAASRPDARLNVFVGGFLIVEVRGGEDGIGHGRLPAKHRSVSSMLDIVSERE